MADGLRKAGTMLPPWVDDLRLVWRLVCRDRAGVEQCLSTRSTPPAALAAFALSHGLASPVVNALENRGASLLPPADMGRLEQRASERTARTIALVSELGRLAAWFDQHGQRFLLLKGPYLAARLYGDPHAREYVDLDLMVPSAERGRAFELLRQAGYQTRSRVLLSTALTCFFIHGFDFAMGNAKVDLHWRLSRHPSLRIDETQLWDAAQSFVLGDRTYAVLGDEYEIVFAVLSLLRDVERGSGKLKNVIDLLLIVRKLDPTTDWNAFFSQREADGTFGPASAILRLCIDLAEAGDQLPNLTAALRAHSHRRLDVAAPISARPLQFPPLKWNLGNRLWAMRAYDTSPWKWSLWWATSLPFRVAAHSPSLRREMKAPSPRPASLAP